MSISGLRGGRGFIGIEKRRNYYIGWLFQSFNRS